MDDSVAHSWDISRPFKSQLSVLQITLADSLGFEPRILHEYGSALER